MITQEDVDKVLLAERRVTTKLSKLPTSFWEGALQIRDKLQTALIVAGTDAIKYPLARNALNRYCHELEQIYEIRAGKIVDQAVVCAAGGPAGDELHEQCEIRLYQDVQEVLKRSKQMLFQPLLPAPPVPALSTLVPPAATSPPPTVPVMAAPTVSLAVQAPAPPPDPDQPTALMAQQDFKATIATPDGRAIKPRRGDIFTIPLRLATVLIKKNMARLLRGVEL